jgi:hypothetical protein
MSLASIPDARLVARCRQGEEDAFDLDGELGEHLFLSKE